MPEWALATGMLGWGFLALAADGLFKMQEFFAPLLGIMSQDAWGIIVAAVGLVRLVFLVINGAWRPSAHIRAIGCALGAMFWATLFVCALALQWLTPSTALFFTLLVTDVTSLWFSAGDAKLADLSARNKLKAA